MSTLPLDWESETHSSVHLDIWLDEYLQYQGTFFTPDLIENQFRLSDVRFCGPLPDLLEDPRDFVDANGYLVDRLFPDDSWTQ